MKIRSCSQPDEKELLSTNYKNHLQNQIKSLKTENRNFDNSIMSNYSNQNSSSMKQLKLINSGSKIMHKRNKTVMRGRAFPENLSRVKDPIEAKIKTKLDLKQIKKQLIQNTKGPNTTPLTPID